MSEEPQAGRPQGPERAAREERRGYGPATAWQRRMVEELVRLGAIRSPALARAMAAVPRHHFVDRYWRRQGDRWVEVAVDPANPESLRAVYDPHAALVTQLQGQVPTSSSSAPYVMACMLEALDLRPGCRVLEVGTGTGYNAALLAHWLGPRRVFSVEIDPQLARAARRRLRQLELPVAVACRDGADGWPEHGPYDRIVVTAGLDFLPAALACQLRPGGILVAPLRLGFHRQVRLVRAQGRADEPLLAGELGLAVGFLPLRGAAGARSEGEAGEACDPPPTGHGIWPLPWAVPLPPALLDPTASAHRRQQAWWDLLVGSGFSLFLRLTTPEFSGPAPTPGNGWQLFAPGGRLGFTVLPPPNRQSPPRLAVLVEGDFRLYRRLAAACRLWEALGQPEPSRFQVAALPPEGAGVIPLPGTPRLQAAWILAPPEPGTPSGPAPRLAAGAPAHPCRAKSPLLAWRFALPDSD